MTEIEKDEVGDPLDPEPAEAERKRLLYKISPGLAFMREMDRKSVKDMAKKTDEA